jgi:DNA-binding NarL/FixJ family response regulator
MQLGSRSRTALAVRLAIGAKPVALSLRQPARDAAGRSAISRRSLGVKRRGALARVAALRERSRRIDQLCVLESGAALVRTLGEDVQPVDSAVAAAAVGALFSESNEVELAFLMRLIAEGDTATASCIALRIVEAKRGAPDAAAQATPKAKTPPAARPRRTPAPAGSEHARGALSPRELNVLRLISQGLSNREIAESSYRSLHTVDAQVKNIYRKLAVNSRAHAVREAMQKGLISLEACG